LKNADSANNLRLRIKLAEGDGLESSQNSSQAESSFNASSAFSELSLEKTEDEKIADERQAIENAGLEHFQNRKKS
jgi:twitching motility protein PilU